MDDLTTHNSPGRDVVYAGPIRSRLVNDISYYQNDFHQAPHHIALCCLST